MKVKNKEQWLLHGIVLIWGYTGIIGKWATIPAELLVFIRMGSAFLALALFLRGKLFQVSKAQLFQYMAIGVIIAAHWVTFFKAIDVSNVSLALSAMASTSVFAAFLEPIFFKRRIYKREILVSVLALFGVSMLFNIRPDYQVGILFALLSSFLAALFTVLGGVLVRSRKEGSPQPKATIITVYQMLGGSLTLFVYFLLNQDIWVSANLDVKNLGLGLILGVVCTAIPFAASINIMKTLKPFTVCLTINMEPIYAIILALIHFGDSEKMTANFYLASAVIIGSVMLNGLLQTYQREKILG